MIYLPLYLLIIYILWILQADAEGGPKPEDSEKFEAEVEVRRREGLRKYHAKRKLKRSGK